MNIKFFKNCADITAMNSKSKIKIVGQVDDYVTYMLEKNKSLLENQAKIHNAKIVLAQRADNLYINTGSITSRLALKDMDKSNDFARAILTNLRANTLAKTEGLDKAFKLIR